MSYIAGFVSSRGLRKCNPKIFRSTFPKIIARNPEIPDVAKPPLCLAGSVLSRGSRKCNPKILPASCSGNNCRKYQKVRFNLIVKSVQLLNVIIYDTFRRVFPNRWSRGYHGNAIRNLFTPTVPEILAEMYIYEIHLVVAVVPVLILQ